MFEYCSVAPHINEIIDCRVVEMRFNFYQAQNKQCSLLAEHYVSELRRLLGDAFYLNWQYSGKNVNESTVLQKLSKIPDSCTISFEGDAFSNIVFDRGSFRQYDRCLQNPFRQIPADPFVSVDYSDVFTSLFGNITDLDQVKASLLKLFSLENRYKKTSWCTHDAMSLLSVRKQSDSLFCGEGYFRIGVFCLGKQADKFANELSKLLKGLSAFLPNLSGHIALTPITASCVSNHMLYFGGNSSTDASHSHEINTQNRPDFLYLSGAEWYNVLSASQVILLSNAEIPKDILTERLNNGGMVVKAASDCAETQIQDLGKIKRFLYPILFPGTRKVKLSQFLDPACMASLIKPRCGWEQIPVFEDEISISEDFILFQHKP